MTDARTNEFINFLQPVSCGDKKQLQTVWQWLDGFSILEDEEFTILWHQRVGKISAILRDVYRRYAFNHDHINSVLLMKLYVMYDLERDFMPQFTDNSAEVLRLAKMIADEAG